MQLVTQSNYQMVPDDVNMLSQEQFDYVLNHVRFDRLKNRVATEETKSRMNLDKVLGTYLKSLTERTGNIYRPIIHDFISSVTHPLDVSTEFVDEYIQSLNNKYAPATVRLRIASLSGFYNKLVRWGYLTVNPFVSCKLPKKQRVKDLQVPSQDDVDAIIRHYTAIAGIDPVNNQEVLRKEMARKMVVVVTLLSELGIRVGAIESLQVKDGRYAAYSKGKKVSGNFNIPIDFLSYYGYNVKNESPFMGLNKKMIQYNIGRLCKDMGMSIHAHSFRHFAAVREYRKSNDIYQVSRFLNHNSVSITENYLKSLEG